MAADSNQLPLSDAMLTNAFLSLIERIINHILQLDEQLASRLNNIEDKRLLIEIRDWQQLILCHFSGQKIHLYATDEQDADCLISANIDTLLSLKNPAMLTQLIRQEQLDLHGDLNVAQGFSRAFSEINIDWPEQLSRYLGDAAAQQCWQTLSTLLTRGNDNKKKLESTLTSLCQDELAVSIHPLELAQFKQQNRDLKGRVSQLELRINALLKSQ
ncbi:SCP2 sterol-binding domain-containing protein [Pseudoalteromonas mariniglutinosa]